MSEFVYSWETVNRKKEPDNASDAGLKGCEMNNSQDAAENGFSLGVLMIGSLYWDCSSIRKKWRRTRLDMDREQHVCVPIRYGRCSQSRGMSYTMVFSAGLSKSKCGLPRTAAVSCMLATSVTTRKAVSGPFRTTRSPNNCGPLATLIDTLSTLVFPRLL